MKIRRMGDMVLGVELEGNPKKPEPEHFRVMFPGGEVDLARLDDGSYWVHLRVNRPDDGWDPDRVFAKITDARLDILDKHAADCDPGDFANPKLYHVALHVKKEAQPCPNPKP